MYTLGFAEGQGFAEGFLQIALSNILWFKWLV